MVGLRMVSHHLPGKEMRERQSPKLRKRSIGRAGLIAILVLLGFLAVTIWYAIHTWSQLAGVRISTAGWIFMALGGVVTFGLGAGLMALVFYSNRKGRDF